MFTGKLLSLLNNFTWDEFYLGTNGWGLMRSLGNTLLGKCGQLTFHTKCEIGERS